MKKIMKKMFIKGGAGLFIAAVASALSSAPTANAASQLTSVKDTMTRQKISTDSDHTISFVTTDPIANNDDIVVTFDADFTLKGTLTEADVVVAGSTEGTLTSVATCGAVAQTAAVTIAGQVMTINLCTGQGADFLATETITITISNTEITNPGSAGLHESAIQTETGATVDQDGKFAGYILTDDQVIVSATVDPILAFAIEGGYEGSEPAAVDFGTLIPNYYHKLLGEKPAYAGIEFTANPAAAETVTVNGQAYTFKATQAEADDQSYYVLQGASWDDTAENLYRAINSTDSAVRAGLDPADPSQIWIVASAAGTGGNAYTIVDGTGSDVTLTQDATPGTFVDGQAGGNYKDDSLGFGVFDTSMGNESEGTNLVISTNATGGYVITVQDHANGLYGGSGADEITSWSGQYGFGLWAKARDAKYGECAPGSDEIIANAYDVDTGANPGALSDTAATLASYPGPTSKDHISIEYVVRIDIDQPAGDYSDTLTYIATSTY